jgi:hypothetical protein
VSRYDTGILLWSDHQADLVRRHAAGERVNAAGLDWPNIIAEVADVGRNTTVPVTPRSTGRKPKPTSVRAPTRHSFVAVWPRFCA